MDHKHWTHPGPKGVRKSLVPAAIICREFFQTEIQLLQTEHWSGIRDSIKAIVGPPGARVCWDEIKSRLNPKFRAFIDTLIS